MIDSRLNQEIGRKLENYNRSTNRQIFLAAGILLLFSIGIFFLNPEITGLAVFEKQLNYSDYVAAEFNENSEYIWIPEHLGLLKSLRLSGSYKTEGNVKIYLEDEGIRYLIFDSTLSQSGLTGITGLVVSDENDNNSIINETIINESIENNNTINETNNNENNTIIDNETSIIENNETAIINESIEINKTININLEYKKDTIYDADNDGIEDIYGVVDLTTENTDFNWQVDESKLCTRWNIESIEEGTSTTACYGTESCCSLIDLMPSKQQWNETLFLTYGLYDASFNNIISTQVIYADINLSIEEPYTEIYYSDWEELPVKFTTEYAYFEDMCLETCSLLLNKTSYKLVIEIDNTTLRLDAIDYIIEIEEEINNAPVLIENIPNQTLILDKLTINLSQYFIDIDDDLLYYNYYEIDNVKINISGNIATIVPDESFTGTVYTYFTANDSYETAISNVFSINISREPEKITKSKIIINKPVKWLKKVKLDEEKTNVSINITSFAANITVKKITVDISEIIPEEKIKIKEKGKLKTLKEHKAEKEKTVVEGSIELIIEELVTEVEVEYFTEGPTSEEIEISYNKKQIIISSDMHYENILAYTNLPIEANSEAVKLYWLVNNSKIEVNIDKFDTNENNLIDYIEWIVPYLSNQTYELEIIILNPYTFLRDKETWTVAFNTTGTANLTINSTNADWEEILTDNINTTDEMRFLNLTCDNQLLNSQLKIIDENENAYNYSQLAAEDSIKPKHFFIQDYVCNKTSYLNNYMNKAGYAALQFTFGSQTAYAYDPPQENLTACGTLSTANILYELNQSVSSAATCFTIQAGNVTIDCKGYTINHSQSSAGYGVYSTGVNYDNITIKNCNITQASAQNGAYGIYIRYADNARIINNTITTGFGTTTVSDYGIYLKDNADNSIITNNTITTKGDDGNYGIFIRDSSNNNITNNIINTSETDNQNHGISLYGDSDSNRITGNTITISNEPSDSSNYGIYLYEQGPTLQPDSNIIESNNITTYGINSYGIYIRGDSSPSPIIGNNISGNIITTYFTNSYGMYLYYTNNSIITNNTIKTNNTGAYGFYLPSSGNNLIYNNLINTTALSAFFAGTIYHNSWNTTKQAGTNIVGGSNIGGNFYATPEGYGYSQLCGDGDEDDICDSPLTLEANNLNIDYHPLAAAEQNNLTSCTSLNIQNFVYNLTQDVNASGTCFTINNVNVTLDCRGYTINHSQSSAGYGVYDTSKNNPTIKNCNIVQGSAQNSAYGIYLDGPDSGIIINNTITTGFGTATVHDYGIYLDTNADNNIIENNTITTKGDDNNYGIYVSSSSNNNITNNIINTSETDNQNYGIYLYSNSDSNRITGNTITTSDETSDSGGIGIRFAISGTSTPDYNIIESNTITTYGIGAQGIYLNSGSTLIRGNNITSNIITTYFTSSYGIDLRYTNLTSVANNNITTYGSDGHGMLLSYTDNSIITNNTIKANNTDAYGFYISSSGDNLIYNNLINTTALGAFFVGTIYNNSWNTTKQAGTNIVGGSNIGGNFYATPEGYGYSQLCGDGDEDDICDSPLTLEANNLNIDYHPLAAAEQNNLTSCTSLNIQNFVYNLTQDVNASGTCFTIDKINVTLDCKGYTITYSQSSVGYGVYVVDKNYPTIKNCNIVSSSVQSDAYGIYLDGPDNARIINNTITTKGDDRNYGIYVSSSSNNNITNNIINTSENDNQNYGIYLYDNSDSNRIIGNTITTSSEISDSSNYGIYLLDNGPTLQPDSNIIESNNITTYSAVSYGMYLRGDSSSSPIMGNNISGNIITTYFTNSHGMILINANNSIITNNTIKTNDTGAYGLYLSTAGDNLIYNNLINTTAENVFLGGTVYPNSWNTTKQAGTNIIEGVNLGGNFYANYSSHQGYSQICLDADDDDICDSARTHEADNIDYLPLAILNMPVVNATLNKSITSIEFNDVINLTANATDDIGLSFGQVIVNDTGTVRYFNFSLSGTADTFSQNITVSCTKGCVINFTARVNDTDNLFVINETIITVVDLIPPVINSSFNISNFIPTDGTVNTFSKINESTINGELGDSNFGTSVANIGDLNGDGVTDLAVGAHYDDDGASNAGAVWILFMQSNSSVNNSYKINEFNINSSSAKNISLIQNGWFGASIADMGDMDGDGVTDLAVGADGTAGATSPGAVYILFMNTNGSVKNLSKISDTQGNFTGTLDNSDRFGSAVANIGDLDGDSVTDLAVGAFQDDDGDTNRGAVWILFMASNGSVNSHYKLNESNINSTSAKNISLNNSASFGSSVANIGDLDGDGVTDLAVGADGTAGATSPGAVYILFMNTNGSVKNLSKISDTQGNFGGTLDDYDAFGTSVANIGDIDGDGVIDLAVGAAGDDDGGSSRGAVWLIFMQSNGSVNSYSKISDTEGSFTGTLDDWDYFGNSITNLGDLNGDGVTNLAVGAYGDDDGVGTNAGAVWLLNLKSTATAPRINDVINASFNLSDNTALSFVNITINLSGSPALNFTYSVSGTSAKASQNITINLTRGNVINITGFAIDSSGNIKQNSTIFTVANTPPDAPTIVYPTSDLYTSTQPLDLNVTATDPDNDALTINYYINGVLNGSTATNTTFNASEGYYILNVSTYDGFDYGANATVNFTIDTTPPIVTATLSKLITSVMIGGSINLSANVTDGIGLDYGMVIVNDTGIKRYFNFSLSGTKGNFTQNITITCPLCTINFTAWVNDTSGNTAINDTVVTFISMNVTININDTIVNTTDPISVYGHINLSNGTNVSNNAVGIWLDGFQPCATGHTYSDGICTATFYPDADPESTSVDGSITYQGGLGSGDVWATLIARNNGESITESTFTDTADIYILYAQSDNVNNEWRGFYRSFFLFDTSNLGNNITINSATLSIYSPTGGWDTIPNNPKAVLVSSNPASNMNLTIGDNDMQSVGSVKLSDDEITHAVWDGSEGYKSFSLNSNGITNINKSGISKFGLVTDYDFDASAPAWASNSGYAFKGYAAEQPGTSQDPKLVVTYTPASTNFTATPETIGEQSSFIDSFANESNIENKTNIIVSDGNLKLNYSWDSPDNFDTSGYSNSFEYGITTVNGSEFWITDYNDDEVYHVNSIFELIDSFDTSTFSNVPHGITTVNGSEFWIVEMNGYEVYHVNSTGDLIDNFDIEVLGSTYPTDITTVNGSEFWITDRTDDEVYHVNSTGDLIDSFDTSGFPASSGITTVDGSEFWIADEASNEVWHVNSTGGLIDNFDTAGFGASSTGGITTVDGSEFWIVSRNDDKVYHITQFFDTSGTSTSNTTNTTYPIVSVTPVWNSTTPANTTLTIEISVDNGTTWINATNSTELTWNYSSANKYLKYRANLSTTNQSVTPELHSITLDYKTGLWTDSQGNYNYTLTPPASLGNHTIKVNTTFDGIYGENSISFTVVDPIPPTLIATLNKSLSNITVNDVINLSASITDNINLSFCQIIINQSGPTALEIINISLSAPTAQCSNSSLMNLIRGNVINYTIRVNDSSNNWRTNDTIITVANTPPRGFSVVYPANNFYTTLQPLELNVTFAEDPDGDTTNISYYINGIFNQSSLTNTTFNASDGYYILNVSITDGVEHHVNLTVNFTIDTTRPVVNASLNKSLSNITVNDVINLTANATDNLGLSFGQIIVNDTGIKRYFNFSLDFRTTATFSQNITISAIRGNVINFTARVNDTSNTFKTNDTIITVANTPPRGFSIVIPTPNQNTSNRGLNVTFTADPDGDTTTINYYINGKLNDSTTTNTTFNASDGSYILNVSITDGIAHHANLTVNFTLDTAPPNVTFKAPMPANDTSGGETITINWTVTDNLDPRINCYPIIDGSFNASFYLGNNSYANTTLTLTGGNHSIKVICYDDANNSNSTEEIFYTVGIVNITLPGQDEIIRPSEKFRFNISVVAGSDWVDNVTLVIFNETFQTQNFSRTLYNFTYTVINVTPRYINATAYGFNTDAGPGTNVTSQIQLRIARMGTTQAPTISYVCPNESYTLNATNITIETIADMDTLIESYNVTIILPGQQIEQPTQTINLTNASYTTYINYTYLTSLEGNYKIVTRVEDIENQSTTFNRTFTVSNSSKDVNITKIGITSLTFKDVCTGKVLISGESATIPNVSYYDADSIVTSAISLAIKNITLNSSVNNTLNFTQLTNEVDAPTGKRRVDLWDLFTNMLFKNLTLYYNYSSIEHTLTHESNLDIYRCGDINNCILTKEDATLDAESNIVITVTNSSRFMLTEPALGAIPDQLDPPQIGFINLSRTYTGTSDPINITVSFNISFQLDTITLTVNSTQLTAINTTASGNTYTYTYNYSPATLGPYVVEAIVKDENTFSSNKTAIFYAAAEQSLNINAKGVNNMTLRDITSNEGLASGTTITVTLPEGKYKTFLEGNTTDITIFNASINNSVSTVFEFIELAETITAPSNRTNLDQFEVNISVGFVSIDFVYNYTSLIGDITDEDNLEVHKCANSSDCNWSEIPSTVDAAVNTLSFTVYNLSIFDIVESIRIEREIQRETDTVTVSVGGGGAAGGGSIVTRVAALDIIVPSSISMHLKDSVTTPIILKNTGDVQLNNINLSYEIEAEGITIEIKDIFFESLEIDDTVSTSAVIKTNLEKPGKDEITIIANAKNPKLEESAGIIIDTTDVYQANITIVEGEIMFALNLFEQNQECLELKELLTQAQTSLGKQEFKKALVLTESAINACKQLVSDKGLRPVVKPSGLFGFRLSLPIIIFALIIILAVIIYEARNIEWKRLKFGLGFKFPKTKHGHRRMGPTKKQIGSYENEEKEIKRMLRGRI